jgi:hypothetical protein
MTARKSTREFNKIHPDEPEDALVADAVLQEADHPFLGNFREERPDIGVEYEVYFLGADPNEERIQRIEHLPPLCIRPLGGALDPLTVYWRVRGSCGHCCRSGMLHM